MSIPIHIMIAWLDIEPLPPITLSKNGRANWRRIHEDFQTVLARARQQFANRANYNASLAWPVHAAIMDVVWCQARGRRPDDDNVFARVAAVRDAAQHVGMVADDKHIRVGEVFYERVLPGEEFCQVQFRTDDAAYIRDGLTVQFVDATRKGVA